MTANYDYKDVIRNLALFNAKERFFLVGHILDNKGFELGDKFRTELGENIGQVIPGTGIFSAMDYHLDWLYASLFLAMGNNVNQPYKNNDEIVKGQQEDIDFIVAFKDINNISHIVLIEAKGVTGWSFSQMDSKAKRFKSIFSQVPENIKPHFLFMSPKDPAIPEDKTQEWPAWMKRKNNYIKMESGNNILKVTRCNDAGKEDKEGKNWMVIKR